jgi:hypothetical protein
MTLRIPIEYKGSEKNLEARIKELKTKKTPTTIYKMAKFQGPSTPYDPKESARFYYDKESNKIFAYGSYHNIKSDIDKNIKYCMERIFEKNWLVYYKNKLKEEFNKPLDYKSNPLSKKCKRRFGDMEGALSYLYSSGARIYDKLYKKDPKKAAKKLSRLASEGVDLFENPEENIDEKNLIVFNEAVKLDQDKIRPNDTTYSGEEVGPSYHLITYPVNPIEGGGYEGDVTTNWAQCERYFRKDRKNYRNANGMQVKMHLTLSKRNPAEFAALLGFLDHLAIDKKISYKYFNLYLTEIYEKLSFEYSKQKEERGKHFTVYFGNDPKLASEVYKFMAEYRADLTSNLEDKLNTSLYEKIAPIYEKGVPKFGIGVRPECKGGGSDELRHDINLQKQVLQEQFPIFWKAHREVEAGVYLDNTKIRDEEEEQKRMREQGNRLFKRAMKKINLKKTAANFKGRRESKYIKNVEKLDKTLSKNNLDSNRIIETINNTTMELKRDNVKERKLINIVKKLNAFTAKNNESAPKEVSNAVYDGMISGLKQLPEGFLNEFDLFGENIYKYFSNGYKIGANTCKEDIDFNENKNAVESVLAGGTSLPTMVDYLKYVKFVKRLSRKKSLTPTDIKTIGNYAAYDLPNKSYWHVKRRIKKAIKETQKDPSQSLSERLFMA